MNKILAAVRDRVDFVIKNRQVLFSLILMIVIPSLLAVSSYFVFDRMAREIDVNNREKAATSGLFLEAGLRSFFTDTPKVEAILDDRNIQLRAELAAYIKTLGESGNTARKVSAKEEKELPPYVQEFRVFVAFTQKKEVAPSKSELSIEPKSIDDVDFKVVGNLRDPDNIGYVLKESDRVLAGDLLRVLGPGTSSLTYRLEFRNEQGVAFPADAALIPVYDNDGRKVAAFEVVLSSAHINSAISRTFTATAILVAVAVGIVLLLIFANSRLFEFAILYKKIKEVDEMKDEFISIASHELRTPLTSIRGYLSIVFDLVNESKTHLDKNVYGFLEQAYESTEDLRNLVNDLLDVSKIEQGRIEFNLTKININTVLTDVAKDLDQLAVQKDLNMAFKPADIPLVTADEQKLKQVFTNLISNAIKYTLTGVVEITSRADGNEVKIDIKDTGVGIPADKMGDVFKKFYRVRSEKTKNVMGTGLGLWITKELVEAMGGRISVESIENVGSKFTVTFPVK